MFKRMVEKVKGKMGFAAAGVATAAVALPTAVGAEPITFTGGITVAPADAIGTANNFAGQYNEWLVLIAGLILVTTIVGFVLWLVKKAPKFSTK